MERIRINGPYDGFVVQCHTCMDMGIQNPLYVATDRGNLSNKVANLTGEVHEKEIFNHHVIVYEIVKGGDKI